MSRLGVANQENPHARPGLTARQQAKQPAATPATTRRGLGHDKTNKAPTVQPQTTSKHLKANVTISKFAPEQLRTPSPTRIRRRLPSPTPGPVIQESSIEEEGPDFSQMEVEHAASDPPVETAWEPEFEVPDWKATDLRAFIHTLPRDGAGIDEALDSKDLFSFEVIDWDSLVLRRDTLEDSPAALPSLTSAARTSRSCTSSTTSTLPATFASRKPATMHAKPTPLDRNLEAILGKRAPPPSVDARFRLVL